MDSSSKRKQGSRRPALLAEGLEERRLLSGRVLDFKFVYHGRAADVGTPTSSPSHPNVTQALAQRAALRFAAAAKAELSREALISARHLGSHARTTGATASPNMPVSTTGTMAPISDPSGPSTPSPTTPTPAGTASATPAAVTTPPSVPGTTTPTTTATPVATTVNPGGPMLQVTSGTMQVSQAATLQLWTDEQGVQAKSGATPDMATAIANDIKALSSQVRTAPGQSQLTTLESDLAAAGVTPTAAQLTTIQADYLAMLTSTGVTSTSLITQTFNDIETYVSAAGVTASDLAMLAADLKAAGLPPNTVMPGDLSTTLPDLLVPTSTAPGQVVFRVPPTNMPTNTTVWTATT
jgi:hypothetical protein